MAKGKFSACVYLRTVFLAAILGGLTAVVWIFKDKIEGLFTKNEPARYLTDDVMRWVLLGVGIIVFQVCSSKQFVLIQKNWYSRRTRLFSEREFSTFAPSSYLFAKSKWSKPSKTPSNVFWASAKFSSYPTRNNPISSKTSNPPTDYLVVSCAKSPMSTSR